jgi:leukotriene-A4 hydrolase
MFSLTSVNYKAFKSKFETFVNKNYDGQERHQILTSVDWNKWVEAPGVAPVQLDFMTPAIQVAQNLSFAYLQLQGMGSPDNFTSFNDMSSVMKQVFLQYLQVHEQRVSLQVLNRIDKDLDLTHSNNPQIKLYWYPLCIRKGYHAVFEAAHEFVSSMGRIKYLNPIYQALIDAKRNDTAVQWLGENIDFYHYLAFDNLKRMIYGDDFYPVIPHHHPPTKPIPHSTHFAEGNGGLTAFLVILFLVLFGICGYFCYKKR